MKTKAEIFSLIAAYLRECKNTFVREVEVRTPIWDHTYGYMDDSIETIEVVDFNRLLEAIDAFGEQLRNEGSDETKED